MNTPQIEPVAVHSEPPTMPATGSDIAAALYETLGKILDATPGGIPMGWDDDCQRAIDAYEYADDAMCTTFRAIPGSDICVCGFNRTAPKHQREVQPG